MPRAFACADQQLMASPLRQTSHSAMHRGFLPPFLFLWLLVQFFSSPPPCRSRGESRKPTEPATGEMIFPGPPFPPNGGRAIFSSIAKKKLMPILFHSGKKRQLKLCSKSVSNYQNQLVEAEKFKKSHTLPDSTVFFMIAFSLNLFTLKETLSCRLLEEIEWKVDQKS